MNKAKVIIFDNQTAVRIPTGVRMLIRRCCNAVLHNEHFNQKAEVEVTFVDDDEIRALNARHRGVDNPTDVLSFPLGEKGSYPIHPQTGAWQLGSIVLNVRMAEEQARRFGHSFQREMGYLTAHSMLHLLGYDHEEGGIEHVRMREKEEDVMSMLGLSRRHRQGDKE